MILHSQLSRRAKIIGDSLSDEFLCSYDGADAIVDFIYKMDAFQFVMQPTPGYAKLLSICRLSNDTYANFEDQCSSYEIEH